MNLFDVCVCVRVWVSYTLHYRSCAASTAATAAVYLDLHFSVWRAHLSFWHFYNWPTFARKREAIKGFHWALCECMHLNNALVTVTGNAIHTQYQTHWPSSIHIQHCYLCRTTKKKSIENTIQTQFDGFKPRRLRFLIQLHNWFDC